MSSLRQSHLDRAEIVLPNPGLVENSADAEHCVHACFQMLFRTNRGATVPSFADLDLMMDKVPGKYTWEYALLGSMANSGFDVKIIWEIDVEHLAADPAAFLIKHYGPTVGQEYIDNSDLPSVQRGAVALQRSHATIERRSPDVADVVRLLQDGYYLTATINQRVLQADPGYVAHSIVIYGASRRGIRIHNPGPPATEASEITWDLFEKAWAYPTSAARNIMAVRPRYDEE